MTPDEAERADQQRASERNQVLLSNRYKACMNAHLGTFGDFTSSETKAKAADACAFILQAPAANPPAPPAAP